MGPGNHSTMTEFILAGLTDKPELQLPLCLFFLGTYMVTVVGNLGMITLIGLSSCLHTPMYHFLSSLSFIGLCQSTVITPKMLVNFMTEKNTFSKPECMTQLYFLLICIISECQMLAVMAYDHYVDICNPLLYNVTMSYQVCSWLVVEVYMIGLIGATAHTVLFFSAFNILAPTLTILGSYVSIIAGILGIHSTEGCSKAFSTCSSHILAVTILYGSAAFMYLQSSNVSSMDQGKVSSVFYTIIALILNPQTIA
ncbi:putative olfactory receptor 8G2 [Loxodonta africana]|uniref:putative olfactory receptor 8G2 n=1 Tax=Loxodonta africana TaxID=9785 RepID=UPI0030D5AA7B